MAFKNSTIDYYTNNYYPYIVSTINLDKEKTFYLKRVYIYKNMIVCGGFSNFRVNQGFLYFNLVDNA